jgi:hypothetical protein
MVTVAIWPASGQSLPEMDLQHQHGQTNEQGKAPEELAGPRIYPTIPTP